jgi:epsilon-lactone hydrolase
MTEKISSRARIVRALLRLRKAATNWNRPVRELRAKAAWADRLTPLPRGVAFERAIADGVPAEWIVPCGKRSDSVVVYVPGGGGVVGMHNVHRRMIAGICRAAHCRALAVQYRLAPESPFPAALEDCLRAWRWLVRTDCGLGGVVLAGDSIGGNIVLGMLLSLAENREPMPARAVTISPVLDMRGTGESFVTDRDPAIPRSFALSMLQRYAGAHDLSDPLLSPIEGNLRGLPPLLAIVGGDELVLTDAMRLRDSARAAGVDVTLSIYPGMWHLWPLLANWLPEGSAALDEIAAFVREGVVDRL